MIRRWLLVPTLCLAACGARPEAPPATLPSCSLVPLAPGAPAGALAFGASGAVWRNAEGALVVSTPEGTSTVELPVPGAATLAAAGSQGDVVTVAVQPPMRHRATLWDLAGDQAQERPALVLDDRNGSSIVVAADDGGGSAVFAAHVGGEPQVLVFRDGDTAWRGIAAPGAVTRAAVAVDDAGTAAITWAGVDDRIATLWLATWRDGQPVDETEPIALFEQGAWLGDPTVAWIGGTPVVAVIVRHAGGERLHVWHDETLHSHDAPAWLSVVAPHLMVVDDVAYIADIAEGELVVARLDDLSVVARGPVPDAASIRGAGARFAIDADGTAHGVVCPLSPAPPNR